MGQFLAVRGDDPGRAREVFDRALAAFAAIHDAKPDATAAAGAATHLAKFARKRVPGTMLVRDALTRDAGLVCGAFVFDNAGEGTADETAVRKLTTALLAGGSLLEGAQRGIDGYFVLAAASGRTGDLHVMTDRVGGLHAYRAIHDGCAIVSTSALVLAAVTGASFDPVAVREMLGSASVFEERSLFLGVEKLAAGTIFTFGAECAVSRRRWWTLADVLWDRAPEAASVERLAESIVAAQRLLLGAYRRPILDLTGGFDSRNLLGAALRTGMPFGTVVNGQETDDDVIAAARIAREFSLDHRNQRPGIDFPEPSFEDFTAACALGDGEANVFDYAPTALAQARTTDGYDLSVNGSFGELCRGYWWDLLGTHLWSRRRFDARRFAAGRFLGEAAWCEGITKSLDAPPLAEHFAGAVERSVEDLAGFPDVAKADAVYIRMRMQRWGGRIVSLTSRIRPSAAPFMFRGPLGAAVSMSPGTRLFGRAARHLVHRLNPRLAALPMDNGSPASPITPLNVWRYGPLAGHYAGKVAARLRRIAGMRPAEASASTTWRAGDVWRLPEMADLLRPESMLTRDLLDRAPLTAFLDRCRGERSSPSATLGRIVTLELAARAVASARTAAAARA